MPTFVRIGACVGLVLVICGSRLLQSLGFTREAHLRKAMKTHIGWCDTWLWGLLADEWPH